MKSFLTTFFFFLACDLGSGRFCKNIRDAEVPIYSEFFTNKIFSNRNLREINCTTDEECQSFILESKCIRNHCECTSDAILSSDASKCLPLATEYGFFCEDNIQCSNFLSVGGMCNDNKCACKSGYHYLKGYCWKNIDLHEKCFRDEQCFSAYEYVGLKCDKNVCICRENYYERLSSGCRRERKVNESCNLDEDCIDDNSTCENMICSSSTLVHKPVVHKTVNTFSDIILKTAGKNLNCSKGMFEMNNTCVRELGMNCSENSECEHIKNAFCLNNLVCACKHVQFVANENNRECLRAPRGKVEDINRTSCKSNSQCGVFGGNSFCQDKRCKCRNNTYFEKEKKFCWTIKSLRESCVDDKDCYPSKTHAECKKTESGKFCDCQEGYHMKGLSCIHDALDIGDSCLDDEDCLFPNSFCNDSNVCTCKENYYLENGKCKNGVGAPGCASDTDCIHLKNTECKMNDSTIKRCLCLKKYTNSEDYKYCLPVVNFNEKCEKSFQCKFPMGDQGTCKENICQCREGEHYLNGKCYKSKFIKESCSSQSECFPGNDNNSVICLKGFCSCNYDYKLDESKICVRTNSAPTIKVCSMSLLLVIMFLALRR